LSLLSLAAFAVLSMPLVAAAQPDVQISLVDWSTQPSSGMVQFHVQFSNVGTMASEPGSGEIRSQAYGAFLPTVGEVGMFQLPAIQAGDVYDVYVTVPRDQLPVGPVKIVPSAKRDAVPCGPDDHWDGNIDVTWVVGAAGGGGHANYHIGHLFACPGGGHSYIHLLTGCQGTIMWSFGGLCPGWHATLVNEDFSPAANPLPAGWTGFIDVTADASVPSGTTCCFWLDVNCGGVLARVQLCSEACDCGTVSSESSSWGSIKSLYK
jgi:hypothetical protein